MHDWAWQWISAAILGASLVARVPGHPISPGEIGANHTEAPSFRQGRPVLPSADAPRAFPHSTEHDCITAAVVGILAALIAALK